MATIEAPVVARALYDSLVQTLEANGAAGELPAVIDAFVELVRGTGPRDAEITSAVALSTSQQEAITKQLRSKYGATLDIKFLVDEDIIGGLITRVGDKVVDDSIRSRMAAVQQRMLLG